MEEEKLIGRKVTGFYFDGISTMPFQGIYQESIGKIGEIVSFNQGWCYVDFGKNKYNVPFPANDVYKHLVEETELEKKDILVGRKIHAFTFKNRKGLECTNHIQNMTASNAVGVIKHWDKIRCIVEFLDGYSADFPSDEVENHLITEVYSKSNCEKPTHYTNPQNLDPFKIADIYQITDPRHFSALKYILRCGKKDDALQELKKSRHCLDLLIDKLEKEKE